MFLAELSGTEAPLRSRTSSLRSCFLFLWELFSVPLGAVPVPFGTVPVPCGAFPVLAKLFLFLAELDVHLQNCHLGIDLFLLLVKIFCSILYFHLTPVRFPRQRMKSGQKRKSA
jgi:hypothetical protein